MRAWILSLVALLVFAATLPPAAAAPAGKSAASEQAAPWTKTGGVSLIVRFDARSATILDARPTSRRPTGDGLHAPLVDAKTSRGYPPDTREMVIAVYRRNGTLAEISGQPEVFGRPSKALIFHDELDRARRGALRGRAYAPREDQRFLDIPLGPDAAFLAFFRSEVLAPGKALPSFSYDDNPCLVRGSSRPGPTTALEKDGFHPVRLSFLSMYVLLPFPAEGSAQIQPSSGLPVPIPRDFEPPLHGFPPFKVEPGCVSHLPERTMVLEGFCPTPNGSYENTLSRLPDKNPANAFDVVILGDGFTDLDDFDQWAKKIAEAVLSIVPPRYQDDVNIHRVRTLSSQKGITHCWNEEQTRCDDTTVSTYYGVQGMWTDPTGEQGGPGYFGTPNLCRVEEEISKIAPRDQIELVIILANCSRYGGDADMVNRIAYLPAYDDPSYPGLFAELVAHESAHAIALLGEEYVSCLPPDALPLWSFPNIATRDDVQQGVWWKILANPEELLPDGSFRAFHHCKGPFNCACEPTLDPGANLKMLGLFWGAMYGECGPPDTECPLSYYCSASCYYRPMNKCKMRYLFEPFCRVCQRKLEEAIRKAISPAD
jgi:hypothetical protein